MTDAEGLLARARQFKFVREAAGQANRGRWVEALQRIGGTTAGQPWCACFTSAILGLWYDNQLPDGLPYTASCDVLLAWARANPERILETPEAGALFLVLKSPTDAIHVGFVTEDITAKRFGTIEGNASDPTAAPSREGFGVFERTTKQPRCRTIGPGYLFVRVTR